MGKLFLTITAITSLFFMTHEISAQEKTGKNADTERVSNTDGFREIQISELPKAVHDAVTKDFPGATISKVFVNEAKEYKLVLQIEVSDEAQILYANEKGEWIEPKKA